MTTRSVVAFLTSITLLCGSTALYADPGNGNGNPHGNGHKGNKSQNYQQGGGYGGPQVDVGGVRIIVGNSRDYWSPGPALPPGIQKKIAQGKPLPPGIAKKLDGRMLERLPRYEGYEWQQVGTDLILVTLATGLIYQVLHNVVD